MRFYTRQHKYYCGVDLHARSIYVCILNQEGAVLLHKNLRAKPDAFLAVIAPFREDLVVAVECMFTWYWIADLCAREGLTFVLGHALYMKAIHGGKAKNDRIDSHKIAHLLRGGNVPFSYVYGERSPIPTLLIGRASGPLHRDAGTGFHHVCCPLPERFPNWRSSHELQTRRLTRRHKGTDQFLGR